MHTHTAHHGLGIVAGWVTIHDRTTGKDFGFHAECWGSWEGATDPRFVAMGPLTGEGARCILCQGSGA